MDPKYWNQKVILAKIEATAGVDSGPAGADAVLASKVKLSPMEGTDVSRELERPYMGAQPTIAIDLHAKLSFAVELVGSGTAGTAPGWSSLIRACGVAETITAGTSVVYNPISKGHESVSIHIGIDGTRYVLLGAKGDAKFTVSASGIPMIEFTFTGFFTLPTEVANVAPDYSKFQAPTPATSTNTPVFTMAGGAYVLRSFALPMGNDVKPRFLIGAERVLITDRSEAVEATIEAVPLTTFNPFQAARDGSQLPIVLKHGTAAGKIVQFDIPKAQMQRPQGLEEKGGIVEWPLRLAPQPTAGNDQWTLTLT